LIDAIESVLEDINMKYTTYLSC